MKLEIKLIKTVNPNDQVMWMASLLLIISFIYGIWIAILLNSNILLFVLTIGMIFIVILITDFICRFRMKRLKEK